MKKKTKVDTPISVGDLWVIIEDPRFNPISVPLETNPNDKPIYFKTGDVVMVIDKVGTGTRSKIKVVSSIGVGYVHSDWWRHFDGEPPLLSRVET